MAENTSSEANKGGNSIENIKKEVGLIGFIGGIIGIIVLIGAAAIFFLDYSKDQKNTDAQNEIFQAQYYYEQDSIELGLLGDGRNLGFLDIIDMKLKIVAIRIRIVNFVNINNSHNYLTDVGIIYMGENE